MALKIIVEGVNAVTLGTLSLGMANIMEAEARLKANMPPCARVSSYEQHGGDHLMPTSTRREKLFLLNNVLEACRKSQYDFRTPALADKVVTVLRPSGFSAATEKEYVRLIVDALLWEGKNNKEFRFADS
jgi:hypothetical protein